MIHSREQNDESMLMPTEHLELTFNSKRVKGKRSPYSITERRVPEPAGDVSHKPVPGGRLPLLSARPPVTPATLEGCYQFRCLVNRGTMDVNSLRLLPDSVATAI